MSQTPSLIPDFPPSEDGGFTALPVTTKPLTDWGSGNTDFSVPAPDISGAGTDGGFLSTPSTRKPVKPWDDGDVGFQIESTCKPIPKWNLESTTLLSVKKPNKVKPQLTFPEEGLCSQKIPLNLSQLASHLAKTEKFCRVGKGLGVYLDGHWRLLVDKESIRETIADLLDEDIVQYTSTMQLDEIAAKVRLSHDIPRYDKVPEFDPHLLSCADGYYQWPEGNILPPSSEIIRFNHLSVSAYEIEPGPTPYFDVFMDNITKGDDALAQRLLEVIGVILTGYPAKSFFLFEGESNTGKSQLATFLKNVLGNTSCFAVNDINDLGGPWTTGMLPGKLLCLCSDVPNKPLSTKAVGLIKQLTGGDPINGAIKYKSNIVFDNTAKLLFLSNFPLQISGQKKDAAFTERLIRIPFRYSVPEDCRIQNLHEKLEAEAGSIIWQSLQALTMFEERGNIFTPIEDPEAIECAIVYTPSEQDLLQAFVEEECILDAEAFTFADVLCSKYNEFKHQRSPSAKSTPVSSFGKLLMGLGLPIERRATNTQRGYKGIRLCGTAEQTSFCEEVSDFEV